MTWWITAKRREGAATWVRSYSSRAHPPAWAGKPRSCWPAGVINNAGFGLYGTVEDIPLDDARYQFEVNLFGLAHLTQLVLPHMRAQGAGRIVNISHHRNRSGKAELSGTWSQGGRVGGASRGWAGYRRRGSET